MVFTNKTIQSHMKEFNIPIYPNIRHSYQYKGGIMYNKVYSYIEYKDVYCCLIERFNLNYRENGDITDNMKLFHDKCKRIKSGEYHALKSIPDDFVFEKSEIGYSLTYKLVNELKNNWDFYETAIERDHQSDLAGGDIEDLVIAIKKLMDVKLL